MMSIAINPYSGTHLFSFLWVFLQRLAQLVTGQLPFSELAGDEVQLGVLFLLGISGALLGSFLVLRRMTMMANSLSHTVLLGLVAAFLVLQFLGGSYLGEGLQIRLPELLLAALFASCVTVLATELLTHGGGVQEDASIGLVFSSLFALAVLLVTLYTRSVHLGLEAIMGNADLLTRDDLLLAGQVLLTNALVFGLFWKEMKIAAFDSAFARCLGLGPQKFHYLLMLLTAATSVAAFRAVGVLLLLALLVAPPLIVRPWTKRLHSLVALASLTSLLSSFLGVALTRHILSIYGVALSTSGMVVVVLGLLLALSLSLRAVTQRKTALA